VKEGDKEVKVAADQKDINYTKLFLKIGLVIILVTIIYGFAVQNLSSSDENRGTFGDLFGGLNAIFSGLAFAGVIVTILMQMKEMDLTRKELKKSATAQEKSQLALNNQLINMQLSSKINSINNFIESHNGIEELNKKEIGKVILNKLTEQIFYSSEYEPFIQPVLIIEKKAILETGQYIQGDRVISPPKSEFSSYSIIIKNNGSSFNLETSFEEERNKELTIHRAKPRKLSGNRVKNEHLKINEPIERNSLLRLTISQITKEPDIKLRLKMTGVFVPHVWEQLLIINIQPELNSAFEEIELMKYG
jgi:hypothetical protein